MTWQDELREKIKNLKDENMEMAQAFLPDGTTQDWGFWRISVKSDEPASAAVYQKHLGCVNDHSFCGAGPEMLLFSGVSFDRKIADLEFCFRRRSFNDALMPDGKWARLEINGTLAHPLADFRAI